MTKPVKKNQLKSSPKSKPTNKKIALKFDRFYRYNELTEQLQTIAAQFPDLATLTSIGKSHEGRDIWVVMLTNSATGPHTDKPAFWADGNIHSIEVSASAACLYFLKYVLEGYGKDADVTRMLDKRTVYICPRVNPDGAEWALADNPKYVRSSTRKYPFDHERLEGYEPKDIDGDGKILRIRIPDANGHWKVHAKDKRVMVRRDPAESGGQYYRILPEGEFIKPEHFDGTRIKVNTPEQGLDLNRNFPENWRGEGKQFGAGDYPTSEPEVKALVDFFIANRNICAALSYHTFSGVLLRPFGGKPDVEMTPEDLWMYKAIGDKGVEASGYPAISVYEEFRYHPKEVITGTSDWMFEHLGIYSWVVEIWSPMRESGIKDYKYIDWFRDHPVEHDLQMMKWNDKALGGKGFVPWRKFKHPQLGDCEIGGWDTVNYISNVPLPKLEKEVAKFPKWMVWQALITPQLQIKAATVERLGTKVSTKTGKSLANKTKQAATTDAQLFKVRLEIQNIGYLPTNVSARSVEQKLILPLIAEIKCPEGCAIESTAGNSHASYNALPRVTFGQLPGWSHKHTGTSFWPDTEPTADIAVAEWIVSAVPGSSVELIAQHPRAGKVTTRLQLE
jgi:murein tripeptide amidase MpaA